MRIRSRDKNMKILKPFCMRRRGLSFLHTRTWNGTGDATRLPHIVPPTDLTLSNITIPAGAIVGISAYSLHFNPTVFPSPHSFIPERWLPDQITEEMGRSFFAFGAGSRACIARNLAMTELYWATERIVEGDVLSGARVPGGKEEKVEIYEWFNSSVKGEKIELVWEG
jgi:hypothetical protein